MFGYCPLGHWDSTEKGKRQKEKKTATLSGLGCRVFLFIYYCPISSSEQRLEVGHWSMFLISRHMPPVRINNLMLTLEKLQIENDALTENRKLNILHAPREYMCNI